MAHHVLTRRPSFTLLVYPRTTKGFQPLHVLFRDMLRHEQLLNPSIDYEVCALETGELASYLNSFGPRSSGFQFTFKTAKQRAAIGIVKRIIEEIANDADYSFEVLEWTEPNGSLILTVCDIAIPE